jgi:hypothetical protein
VLGLLFVPAASFAAGDDGGKQIVVVQGGVEVPPPPTIVVGVEATPPPPVVVVPAPAPQPVYVAPVEVAEESDDYSGHNLSVGIGVPLCMFASVEGFGGADCVNDEFVWLNFPILYHYRVNSWFAAGGGLMLNVFAVTGADVSAVGAELVGGVRFYAVPDWLYFDLNIMLGFPFFAAFEPALGLAIPLGPVSIYLENQVTLMYVGGLLGFWQPVLGVQFHF